MPGTFSPSPHVSDPDMHHGTCVTHVPWCMPGSLTSGFIWNRRRGKTFPAFRAHAQPAILRIWKEVHGLTHVRLYLNRCRPNSLTNIWITRPRCVISILTSIFSHNNDVIMGTMASQITNLTIIYSTVDSARDERKHQSSALLAFVMGIHRWPVNSPHKGPVTRKIFHLMTSSWCMSISQ